ncbi:MAG: LuxR C-terminal-related transcriptional regulator [Arthrobacter sp.]
MCANPPGPAVGPRPSPGRAVGPRRSPESAVAAAVPQDAQAPQQHLARVQQHRRLGSLTPRERDVLDLMAQGRTNAGICAELFLSAGAVEKHVTSIFSKLDLAPAAGDHRRVLAVLQHLQAASPGVA